LREESAAEAIAAQSANEVNAESFILVLYFVLFLILVSEIFREEQQRRKGLKAGYIYH